MPEPRRVLVADDDETIRFLVRETLRSFGVSLSEAPDGLRALELARAERPDLVVLDVMMPGMDGWAVCRELKGARDPPRVVMISARALEDDRATGIAAGADAYLVKPFSPATLLRVVQELLG